MYIIQGTAGRDQLRLPQAALRDEARQGGARVPDEDGKVVFLTGYVVL